MDTRVVELLQYTPLELLRVSLSKPYKTEVFTNPDAVNTPDFLGKVKRICIDNKHSSVLEHVVFSYHVKNISRLCLQELVRHRIASYTVESTRYVLPKNIDEIEKDVHTLVTEDNIDKLREVAHKYIVLYQPKGNGEDDIIFSEQLNTLHTFLTGFLHGLKDGRSFDSIKYILPECWKTSLVVTMNLRSMINFARLRLDKRAHIEIRSLAMDMVNALPKEYIELIEYACLKNNVGNYTFNGGNK